ncbi:Type-1 restriction enzyme R protein [Gemmata sp. SH-PL17]|uniref:type I restriction endonuclease subunit R n=1 Tax=Gemmata sp. SH-PL17 TaxID=1630693 RepID=UPI00078B8858|nr:DEAD/DEAH box helicase family protein [Gemmata sp. SH-PL17]AMV29403.1 Type-1 restriction enzyme R protein [Gemmata sp. SH-PL17]
MTPEQKARLQIDRLLTATGWVVQDFADMNVYAGVGVAVREFQLKTGAADYLLYADGKVIGVVEAKPEGHTLTGVETQSAKYAEGLPKNLPAHSLPLPFAYESTGSVTQFTNYLEPDSRSREVFSFHQPEELLRLVGLEAQVRARLKRMPPLDTTRLWSVQEVAIRELEKSLAANRPRALIQMATGSGKTFTAVNACYRLAKFAGAKRILFLVDRNNLGRQTLNEFQQFTSPYTGMKFTDEYTVTQLKKNSVPSSAKVTITTIQRLFSILKGDADYEEENEEGSLYETDGAFSKKPVEVEYNPSIPIESFDFIVVDECHRSIYNLWRQVLDYFDAFTIGLTATPTAQTLGFFNQNLVQDYSHERAVADGVNVGYDVFRIETQVCKNGVKLVREPGAFVLHRDRRTKKRKLKELDEDKTFTATQLDRDVVVPAQIRLVIQTFRDNLPIIFPGRTEVPKTLIFAKVDQHAEDIVQLVRDEFGKGNEFCQKITSKTTGKKPEDLLADFRNSYFPRVAVTVDMIATGTDVKPLECLIFMRNVKSLAYFEQMKGRGCRVVDADTLKSVTPDANAKTHFVIVDAVGVCEDEKQATKSLNAKPSIPFDKVLDAVKTGVADAELVSTLASRLTRLERQLTAKQEAAITKAAGGATISDLAASLLTSIDPDEVVQHAVNKFQLPHGQEPTDAQFSKAEEERMREALKPFHVADLRRAILDARAELEQVVAESAEDMVVRAEFDAAALEKAKGLITSFREFLEVHREEIEALQILYSRPHRAGLRYSQVRELADALKRPPHRLEPERVWTAFATIAPTKVKSEGGKKLVDVVALVRHALDPSSELASVERTVDQRYQAWLKEQANSGMVFSPEHRKWLDAIKDHIATSLSIDRDDLSEVPFNQMGGLGKAHQLFGDELTGLLEDLNTRLAA